MADAELHASWARAERHLREALHHQVLPEETRVLVLDFIAHNELGVAFESIVNSLVETGAALEPAARAPLAAAAREMQLDGNADCVPLSR